MSASTWALVGFLVYMTGVFVLAWLSGRKRSGSPFLSEYFLGNRSLGMWAFALTFAATNASGGSFMGFPSLIYTHGWSLALWIASYMVVPLVTMGLLAKPLNQIARRAGAVTVPEVLRERFDSVAVGLLSTLMLVLFMFFYLLAQFKAGSIIMTSLLGDMPAFQTAVSWVASITAEVPGLRGADPDYVLCLFVFGVTVIAYTTYGGFRAVVWTDVMQGLVMGAGVVVLLILTLVQVGGLPKATRALAAMIPPDKGQGVVRLHEAQPVDWVVRKGSWITPESGEGLIRTARRLVIPAGSIASEEVPVVRVHPSAGVTLPQPETGLIAHLTVVQPYKYGAQQPGVYTRLPGPDPTKELGFLSFGMAMSFFVFWAFGGAGQPSNMVRTMAFRSTGVLRRSIAMVAVYYSLIYFPLIVIFCCGRVLLPGMEIDSDRVMPELAMHVTTLAKMPWLAGLLIAAPFAAVMSSVDSFLLVVSSALVRDVYQRSIHPHASQRAIRRLTYLVTCLVGVAAAVASLRPPAYLQDMSVFASSGLAACFLVPMFLGLYWKRMNAAGALVAILGGGLTHVGLYVLGYLREGRFAVYPLLNLHPFLWDMVGACVLGVVVALLTRPTAPAVIAKLYGTEE